MELDVVRGDITELSATAIVNAANNRMRGGGGVDGAIHRAAGRGLLAELVERFPDGLATGDAGWSHGHNLPARYVIHVVGPIYRGSFDNRDQLISCYRRALEVADGLISDHDLTEFTIAFPLISAGVYGWPKDDAIRCAFDTLRAANTSVSRATLVAFDDSTHASISAAL
jgi:O-acetyl-ADP-ribose deacetylase